MGILSQIKLLWKGSGEKMRGEERKRNEEGRKERQTKRVKVERWPMLPLTMPFQCCPHHIFQKLTPDFSHTNHQAQETKSRHAAVVTMMFMLRVLP